MSSEDSGLTGLQFDRVEPLGASAGTPCAICSTPVSQNYYLLNGHTICTTCAEANRFAVREEPTKTDLGRAALYGFGAALAGTAIYFAILALSGYEIGLIAIAVGWLVGKAVNKGGRGLGGRKLQILAVLLTYLSIVGGYVPLMVKQAIEDSRGQKKPPAVVTESAPPSAAGAIIGLAVLVALILAMPFLQGFSNIIGIFIIGIGLFEAWKWNRRAPVNIEGPFPATPAAAGA